MHKSEIGSLKADLSTMQSQKEQTTSVSEIVWQEGSEIN